VPHLTVSLLYYMLYAGMLLRRTILTMLFLSFRCGASRSQDLHNEIDNLRSLLDARPTMRQWTEAQRER
jgi:hypothetical protein